MGAEEKISKKSCLPEKTFSKDHFGVIFLTIFIDLAGFSIIFPLFPAMLDYYLPNQGEESLLAQVVGFLRNWTRADGVFSDFLTHVLFGGILGSLYSLLQFFFSPLWGRFSDRYGRRLTLLYTIAGTTLSYLLWFFSGSFWLLVLARVLSGITSGSLAVATAAVADITSKKDRAKGMAFIGVAFGLGFLMGPAIGGFSALIDLTTFAPELEKFGLNPFSVPALFAFLLSGINLVWVLVKFKETLLLERRRVETTRNKKASVTRLFTVGPSAIRRASLIYFIFILAFSGMEFTLTFLAAERLGYNPADNAFMFLFIGFILIFVQGGLVRKLAPRLGEKPLALAGLVSGMAAFGLLAFALIWVPFYSGLAFLALGVGLATPTLSALVSLYATEEEQGRHLGGFRAAGSLARALGPLLAASIYWYMGSRISYLFGMLVLILPIILAFSLPQPNKHDLSPQPLVPVP